jgi:nitrite reductase/ring-hydroxylating ferredoxin subunit
MSVAIAVASVDEVLSGDMKRVEAAGLSALLLNVDGVVYAVQLECPHQAMDLDLGELDGETLTCPAHGSEFDVVTGSVQGPPAESDLRIYEVEIRDGAVYLVVPEG